MKPDLKEICENVKQCYIPSSFVLEIIFFINMLLGLTYNSFVTIVSLNKFIDIFKSFSFIMWQQILTDKSYINKSSWHPR